MKKIVIEKPGSHEVLEIKSFDLPLPKEDEILIEVKASGVNFADCMIRMGLYSSAKEFIGYPITPGFEVSGIVKACGSAVTKFKPGDHVTALSFFGGYASHVILKEDQVFRNLEILSFEQAASLPVVFLTAYYALFELGNPRRGQKILVHSAAGGVGGSIVQLAKRFGLNVTAVVGAPHKVQAALNAGADVVIDKSVEPLWERAKAVSKDGFSLVFDANGVETLKESYQHLAPSGRLIIYGFHTMFKKGASKPNWFKLFFDYIRTPRFNPLRMTNENRSVMAFNLSYLFSKKELLRGFLDEIYQGFQKGELKCPPVVPFPVERVGEAQKLLESGNSIGKIVLTF